MARKVNYNTTDTLSTFQTKVNLEADYVGDLDDLNAQLKFGAPFYTPGILDSAQGGFAHQHSNRSMSLINALNAIESGYEYVHGLFNDSTGVLNVHNLLADSGQFNKVRTGTLITDSDFLILDSARFNRVVGRSLIFDSAHIDSARIDFVSGKVLNYDSGFRLINTGPTASGLTTGVPAYWPGTGDFNILRFDSGLTADSGAFTNLSGVNLNYDSSTLATLSVDSVHLPNNTYMNELLLESSTFDQLNFDTIGITDLKKLVLTGRSPLDSSTSAAVGSIVLAGHLVSTNNDSAIV